MSTMETATAGRKGVRGEESLSALLVLRTVVLLAIRSQAVEWLTVSNWENVLFACCLILIASAVYNFPVRKEEDHAELVFRPGVNAGVYCVLLVPLAVLAETLQSPLSEDGGKADMTEVVFLLVTVCGMLLLAPFQLRKMIGVLYMILVLAASIVVISLCVYTGVLYIPLVSGLMVVMCCVYYLPHLCPWSFTFGELCVVCHILGSAVFRMTCWMIKFYSSEEWPAETNEMYIYAVICVLLVMMAVASSMVLHWDWCDNIVPFVLVYVACGLIAVAFLMLITGHNPVVWFFWYILEDNRRIALLAWWTSLTIVTVISLSLYIQQLGDTDTGKMGHASTAARKMFHCIVLAVYVPGLVVDPMFLLLASTVALAALIFLEIGRVINVEWLGPAVENSFRVFVDDRDQGPVLLTHIYLLVGLSLPLWMTHNIFVGDVRNFCGVISIGIGDTVACVVGMQYGKTKWPGTKKSLEGTAASVIVQLMFVILAYCIGWLEGVSWLSALFAIITSSVFEALVSQIDNLVLPAYMLAALPSLPLLSSQQ